ncbi:MAG TPA: glycosyltransferase [Planctomycetota bacterium]|nr:glycosyltransferase [Planctomycetota bacterium]
MRIAVVTSLYPSASLPREGVFAERRWLAMAARGHAVRIIRPVPRVPWPRLLRGWRHLAAMARREERGGLSIECPRYLHLPGGNRRDARNGRAFARAALGCLDGWRSAPETAFSPEVVICDYAWPAAALAPLLARRALPCLIHGRGSDVLEVAQDPALAPLLGEYLAAAGHWCAVSRDLVSAMDRLAGAERGSLTANGVDLDGFPLATEEDRRRARAELGLAPEGQLILAVGHLIQRKQPLVALGAFGAAAEATARLAFIGRGPLEGELRSAVVAAGLGARVSLVGELPPEVLARWYAACDLVLLPSTREGRPNVVLEALSCGRPVLATAVGGSGELLGDCPQLLCVGTGQEEFSAALAELLAGGALPAAGELRKLVEPLTWERACEALEQALERALAGVGGETA